MNIIEPTLLLDRTKCLNNIRAMAEKARLNNLIFRPHFKTHQSREIGNWFRKFGVEQITVSSLGMAEYFAAEGWQDITVAFPANLREIERTNRLAGQIRLNLLVESVEAVQFLKRRLRHRVKVFIKIDSGYHRTGISPENSTAIESILQKIDSADLLQFAGFLTHAGHSYRATSRAEILQVHQQSVSMMRRLKKRYGSRYPELVLSVGDTPTCSVAEDFTGIDEIRPGNFMFYDLTQWRIGSCRPEQIAVAVACPAVAKHPERSEVVLYGGAVHFSKEFLLMPEGEKNFGYLVDFGENGWEAPQRCCYLKSLSQEHGILHTCPTHLEKIQVGGLVGILPVHSCLTANLMKSYLTLEGERIERL